MSRAASSQINSQLTTFAVGFVRDSADITRMLAFANRLAPMVQVPSSAGQYKVFNEANGFRAYGTARALGGNPNRIGFSATDGTFSCKPQALEVTIDEEEYNQAGNSPVATELLRTGKVRALLSNMVLGHVNDVVTAAQAVTAETDVGNWSSSNIDPIDQLDSVIDSLATAVGGTQFLRVDMSLTAWRTLRNHPKTKARCSGVQVGGINLAQLGSILAIPVDVQVQAIAQVTAKEGQSSTTKSRVAASDVFVHYTMDNPTVYDPSGFKTFTVGQNMVTDVRSYQAENGLWEGHYIGWSRDIKQTSTLSFRRIAVS